MKNADKMDILTRAVSTGVFTSSVLFFLCCFKFACFAENTIKIVFSAKATTCVENWCKVVLKIGPSMLRNKLDQFSTQEMGLFFGGGGILFVQGEREFQNKWTSF